MAGFAELDLGDVTQWSAGVDWLTMTWKDDSDEGAYRFIRNVCGDAAHETSEGSVTWEPAVVLGYRGSRAGSTFHGRLQGQGCMLVASGAAAHWIAAVGRLEADNVPRIDVQATVWASRDVGHMPGEVAKRSVAARLGAMGRPWKVRLQNGFGEGDTAYLGSRQSDLYCRCYDKGRESGEAQYKQALRYEIECKGQWASRAYANLLERGCSRPACFSIVAGAFDRRGVVLPAIRPTDAPFELVREDVADRTERTLNWYRDQVAPSVGRLLTEGVSRRTILDSLGLG